jgi:hypothetical protein
MAKDLYTAEAHVTGGRAAGHGRTSDGALEFDLRSPTEMGGEGGGTNPEQLSRSAGRPASRAPWPSSRAARSSRSATSGSTPR